MQRIKNLSRFLTIILFLLFFVPYAFSATIDVMIVFDSTAKSWVDSNGGMNMFAVDAVARMNQATANSNVNLTFRLVYAAEVSYTHSTLSTDLSRLQSGSGNLSVVHSWRNTYGADVVVMMVDTGSASGTVGLGYLLTTYAGTPAYAYSVCAIRSVDISHTMTHEVGHNLGCDHSKFQRSDPGPNTYLNTYSAGWYFTGTNSISYNTIMAYSSDGYGGYYVEAPLFSTPLESYQGTVAGDAADGDNSRNILETMDIVAAYLPSTISDPDQFTFIDQTDVPLNTVITSNEITVSGLSAAAIIYISGGTYSINGGTYTSAAGTVNNGDTVTVRLTSSGSYSTTISATLTIGSISDAFSVTTEAAPPDTTPDQFTFTDQTGVALSAVITSNTITVSGINAAAPISITGGMYSINGGTYTSGSGTVNNGNTVTVQLTSSGSYSTTTNATLTIGGVSDTFSVTTQEAPDTIPNQFTFTDRTAVALNTVITSNAITVSGINTAAPISITGGNYSINGGAYTSDAGTVNNGNTVTVQLTSFGSYSTTTDATLTIGGVSDTFSVTTQSAPVSGGGGGGGGGCFIATAAFGSPLAGQVEILRKFRDRYLLTNAFGRKFVAWYYRVGPVAASYIKNKPLAKALVRVALYPLIGFSLLLINGIAPYLVFTGFAFFFMFRLRKSFVT
ncbi:MAG: hypothetical protein APR62_12305 [Smithella sp. SDB]|nr:MAG: hypothetical protein APR62_12305 [Smithella sp. SDB]